MRAARVALNAPGYAPQPPLARPARDLTRAGSEQAALLHDELRETARGVARIADLHVSARRVAVLHRQVQLPVGDLDTKGGQRVLLDDDDAALGTLISIASTLVTRRLSSDPMPPRQLALRDQHVAHREASRSSDATIGVMSRLRTTRVRSFSSISALILARRTAFQSGGSAGTTIAPTRRSSLPRAAVRALESEIVFEVVAGGGFVGDRLQILFDVDHGHTPACPQGAAKSSTFWVF